MIYLSQKSSVLALCVLAASTTCAVYAATYRAVAYMTSHNSAPIGIVEGAPGMFFVQASGSLIFSVTTGGAATNLATFPDPPWTLESAPGAMAENGLLYSSIAQVSKGGGSGNIFSVSSSAGSEQTFEAQRLVMTPVAGTQPTGILFGLVYKFADATTGVGTTDLGGHVTSLYQFPGTDRPVTPIYGSDGNYYGTAFTYGAPNGYFYKVTPSGSFSKVATLPFQGTGIVLQGTDGNFYGAQGPGCASGAQPGAIYKMTPSGQFTTLHEFKGCNNAVVDSLIEGSDGKLYGATHGNNVIFSLTKSGTYKVQFETTNGETQGLCTCILTQGSDGIIYGTALGGGPGGFGLVFALDAGLPVPQPQAREFSPQAGAAGARVRIWGYNLLGASVSFNGVLAAKVSNGGPNYVWAIVPASATTGPITVTTPGGTSTTAASFTVN